VIDHPLITIPVEVEQDDATQRIRVCPAGAPEVEARCLAGLTLADRAGYMSVRQSVNDEGTDLWDAQVLRSLMQPLIRTIDDEGTLVDSAPSPAAAAVADGSWVLFMRRRLPDYQGFLDRMRALYRDESVPVPDTLQAVVSDASSALAGGADGAGDGSAGASWSQRSARSRRGSPASTRGSPMRASGSSLPTWMPSAAPSPSRRRRCSPPAKRKSSAFPDGGRRARRPRGRKLPGGWPRRRDGLATSTTR
jgi:hypothetical protein